MRPSVKAIKRANEFGDDDLEALRLLAAGSYLWQYPAVATRAGARSSSRKPTKKGANHRDSRSCSVSGG
jgi:hypothetical protein